MTSCAYSRKLTFSETECLGSRLERTVEQGFRINQQAVQVKDRMTGN